MIFKANKCVTDRRTAAFLSSPHFVAGNNKRITRNGHVKLICENEPVSIIMWQWWLQADQSLRWREKMGEFGKRWATVHRPGEPGKHLLPQLHPAGETPPLKCIRLFLNGQEQGINQNEQVNLFYFRFCFTAPLKVQTWKRLPNSPERTEKEFWTMYPCTTRYVMSWPPRCVFVFLSSSWQHTLSSWKLITTRRVSTRRAILFHACNMFFWCISLSGRFRQLRALYR